MLHSHSPVHGTLIHLRKALSPKGSQPYHSQVQSYAHFFYLLRLVYKGGIRPVSNSSSLFVSPGRVRQLHQTQHGRSEAIRAGSAADTKTLNYRTNYLKEEQGRKGCEGRKDGEDLHKPLGACCQ